MEKVDENNKKKEKRIEKEKVKERKTKEYSGTSGSSGREIFMDERNGILGTGEK